MAEAAHKRLTVKEWKCTPDGKNSWVDHIEIYNERNKVSKVRKFEYDSNGVCTRRLNYNANGTLNSFRKFEYSYE